MSIKSKIRIYRTYVRPGMTYVTETRAEETPPLNSGNENTEGNTDNSTKWKM